jgi:hypothetical protein
MKYALVLFLVSIQFQSNLAHADGEMHPAPEDGNQITDPLLADYLEGYRMPGILVEPYDIVEVDDVSLEN